MTTPSSASVERARQIIDEWVHGQEIVKQQSIHEWISSRRRLHDLIALALDAVWEEAAKLVEIACNLTKTGQQSCNWNCHRELTKTLRAHAAPPSEGKKT